MNVLPICDGGGHFFDRDFLKEITDLENSNEIPRIFNLMAGKSKKLAIIKNDFILHYATADFKRYIYKLKWRIVGNVHYGSKIGTGFSNREEFQPVWFKYKKYLFIPYSFSLFLPLFASIYLSVSKKQIGFLLNFPLTVYTAYYIVYQYFLRLINIKPQLRPYGN